MQEMASNPYGLRALSQRAYQEFFSGLRKVKLSFQYGKDSVEYSEDSSQ